MKFQTWPKNLTITDHIIACVNYFFNEKWYNSLPTDTAKAGDRLAPGSGGLSG
jgi:TRAP-type C4-dicarboxylate transport system substrate-binding protein